MGEITRNDKFGSTIIHIVKELKLKNILEIGSWDGTGSTQCFIEGMNDFTDKKLYCLEINKDRFKDLVKNTSMHSWIKCYNQTSISYNSLLYKDFNEIWDSSYNRIKFTDTSKSTAQQWFNEDVENIKKNNLGFLEEYSDHMYDGVLIDGSEFTGYSEYMLLKNRARVLFLDDYYNSYKTNQIARELLSIGWEVIAGDRYTRNGFAVFKRNE